MLIFLYCMFESGSKIKLGLGHNQQYVVNISYKNWQCYELRDQTGKKYIFFFFFNQI